MGLKHLLQVAVWAVGLATAGGAFADLPDDLPAWHQNVLVYKSTDPTDYSTSKATLIAKTDVIEEVKIPFGGSIKVWGPKCVEVEGVSKADCAAAKDVYADVQATADVLNDHRLGPGSTVNVIMMKNNHPSDGTTGGLFDPVTKSVVLYPNAPPGATPHEVAHVYVDKYHGTATASAIKEWGVNEGFAKITAHRVTGSSGAWPPSADNVADILNGNNCGTHNSTCAHDIGNLVFEAYEIVVGDLGASAAFKVYRDALLRLGVLTPATLHEKVGEVLEERYPRLNIPIGDTPDPFDRLIWDAWWQIFWLGVQLCP